MLSLKCSKQQPHGLQAHNTERPRAKTRRDGPFREFGHLDFDIVSDLGFSASDFQASAWCLGFANDSESGSNDENRSIPQAIGVCLRFELVLIRD